MGAGEFSYTDLHEGYRGAVQAWECDSNDHLNVSFHFGRFSDNAFFVREWLGIGTETQGTVSLVEHARFHAEARQQELMVARAAPIEIREKTMRVYSELRRHDGTLLTSLLHDMGHFDLVNRRLLAWSDETRAQAEAARIDCPDHAKPLRISAEARHKTQPTIAQTQAAGFFRTGGTAVNEWECDQFQHMNTMFYIRRLNEAVPHFWPRAGVDLRAMMGAAQGIVVGEMRVTYIGECRSGEAIETYSGLVELDKRSFLLEHRMYNKTRGRLAAIAQGRGVMFDRKTRRAGAVPAELRDAVTPYLIGDRK